MSPVGIYDCTVYRSAAADDICCIQPFRPLLALELDCLAFIQRLIPGVLNRREVNEYVFSCRTLNESIAFCAIKPLHYATFLHIDSFAIQPCHTSSVLP
jgi:hypothetical protein